MTLSNKQREKLDRWLAVTSASAEICADALKVDRDTHKQAVAYVRQQRSIKGLKA